MKKYRLEAEIRTLFGKKNRKLRTAGKVPGNVFGKNVKSEAVEVAADKLLQAFTQVGETGLLELAIDKDLRAVLIQNIQIHPVTQKPLHVDFHQVNLKEKVKVNVPLEITGIAPAVEQKLGVLLTLLDQLEVEALPTDLPEKILVDVSVLTKVGNAFSVANLSLPKGVTILNGVDVEIVKIGALVTKEAEELVAQEAATQAAAATETAAVEVPPAETKTTEPSKTASK
ncbi:MAG: 50S ribosomal protein L25 [Patescibacteria group bacterium]